jgi:hypothetical protein
LRAGSKNNFSNQANQISNQETNMINQKTRTLFIATALLGANQAYAANIKCMPAILNFAVKAFDLSREQGLIALDSEGRKIELGSDIEVKSVEIHDLQKDAYKISFRLGYIDGSLSHSTLQTVVHSVNYTTCSIYNAKEQQLLEPRYRILEQRR